MNRKFNPAQLTSWGRATEKIATAKGIVAYAVWLEAEKARWLKD